MSNKKSDAQYICQYCGATSDDLEDFEADEIHHKGFWCPYCDGFTYFDSVEKKQQHGFILMLEQPGIEAVPNIAKPTFPTRVSPLRYPGGKSKVIGQILAKCRNENMVNFAEPYAGGASVGLSLLLAGKVQELYLNDLDFGIYSLYEVIRTCPDLLIKKIQSFIPTKEAYQDAQKHVLNDSDSLDMLDAAWYTLIVNRMAYSGICKANCMSNPAARWNSKTLVRRIRKMAAVADHIHVTCADALEKIEEWYWMPNTTILIDPPYFTKGKALYHKYYNFPEHAELAFLLESLHSGMPGADMILTYDMCEVISELYVVPKKEILERTYSVAN